MLWIDCPCNGVQSRVGNTNTFVVALTIVATIHAAHKAILRFSENRTLTKITEDSGQRLNSFVILSVTESDNQFPAENRDPRIDRQ